MKAMHKIVIKVGTSTLTQGTQKLSRRYILPPFESWSFAVARGASLRPTRPGPSFSIVTWAGSDANLSPLALANSPTFHWRQYMLGLVQQIAHLQSQGLQLILVSSGAVRL